MEECRERACPVTLQWPLLSYYGFIPPGVHITKQGQPRPSPTPKGPLASQRPPARPPLPAGSGPPDHQRSHTLVPNSRRCNLPPSSTSSSFLSDCNKQSDEKPNSGTAEPALCPGCCHSERDASMLRSLHIWSGDHLRGHHHIHLLFPFILCLLPFIFVTLSRCGFLLLLFFLYSMLQKYSDPLNLFVLHPHTSMCFIGLFERMPTQSGAQLWNDGGAHDFLQFFFFHDENCGITFVLNLIYLDTLK